MSAAQLNKILRDLSSQSEKMKILALMHIPKLPATEKYDTTLLQNLLQTVEQLSQSNNPDVVYLARKSINVLQSRFSLQQAPRIPKAGPPETPVVETSQIELSFELDPKELEFRLKNLPPKFDYHQIPPFFEHENERVVANAVEAFMRLAPIKDQILALAPFLQSENNRIRGNAIIAIGRADEKAVLPSLSGMLNTTRIAFRESAVYAMSQLPKRPAFCELLLRCLHDPYRDIRLRAIQALREYPYPEVLSQMKRLANDVDIEICEAASDVISHIEPKIAESKNQPVIEPSSEMEPAEDFDRFLSDEEAFLPPHESSPALDSFEKESEISEEFDSVFASLKKKTHVTSAEALPIEVPPKAELNTKTNPSEDFLDLSADISGLEFDDLFATESKPSAKVELPELSEDLPALTEDLPALTEELPALSEELPSLSQGLSAFEQSDFFAPKPENQTTPVLEALPDFDTEADTLEPEEESLFAEERPSQIPEKITKVALPPALPAFDSEPLLPPAHVGEITLTTQSLNLSDLQIALNRMRQRIQSPDFITNPLGQLPDLTSAEFGRKPLFYFFPKKLEPKPERATPSITEAATPVKAPEIQIEKPAPPAAPVVENISKEPSPQQQISELLKEAGIKIYNQILNKPTHNQLIRNACDEVKAKQEELRFFFQNKKDNQEDQVSLKKLQAAVRSAFVQLGRVGLAQVRFKAFQFENANVLQEKLNLLVARLQD